MTLTRLRDSQNLTINKENKPKKSITRTYNIDTKNLLLFPTFYNRYLSSFFTVKTLIWLWPNVLLLNMSSRGRQIPSYNILQNGRKRLNMHSWASARTHAYTRTHTHIVQALFSAQVPKMNLWKSLKFDQSTKNIIKSCVITGQRRFPSLPALARAHAADTCARPRPPEVLPTNFIYQ